MHIWQAWCGTTIHDLRRNRFFPLYPDVRLTVKKFFLRHMQTDYGQRIFGYVHPPVSGSLTEIRNNSIKTKFSVSLVAFVYKY